MCETHTISDVCEVTAVLPVAETQMFEHHFRLKIVVENVTSNLLPKHLELNENFHLHVVLTVHNHQSVPHSIIHDIRGCSTNEGRGEGKL